jgi:hypothetical protein
MNSMDVEGFAPEHFICSSERVFLDVYELKMKIFDVMVL